MGWPVGCSVGPLTAIGASLERVQGANRLLLEQYRRRALDKLASQRSRLESAKKRPVEVTAGYAGDATVLRQRVLVPLERFQSRRDVPAPSPTDADPFRDDSPQVEGL